MPTKTSVSRSTRKTARPKPSINRTHIVAAYTASPGPKWLKCMVVRKNDMIPATHNKVYGPNTRPRCLSWKAAHCQPARPVKRATRK